LKNKLFFREGNWIPHPQDIECSVVDCGPPPVVRSGETTIDRPSFVRMSNVHFSAPNGFRNTNPFSGMG